MNHWHTDKIAIASELIGQTAVQDTDYLPDSNEIRKKMTEKTQLAFMIPAHKNVVVNR